MTRLVDDIDGSQAVTTVSFSLDGRTYEIDLSESHLSALQQALAPFVTAARSVPGGHRPARTPAAKRAAAADQQVAREVIATGTPAAPPRAADSPADSPAVDRLPFRQPDPARERVAAPARSKPAPLVADPFNPRP